MPNFELRKKAGATVSWQVILGLHGSRVIPVDPSDAFGDDTTILVSMDQALADELGLRTDITVAPEIHYDLPDTHYEPNGTD